MAKSIASRLKAATAAIALVGAVGLVPGTAGADAIVDLSDVDVDGGSTTTLNTTILSGGVTQIDFDFSLTAFSPSWGSEVFITITSPSDGSFTASGGDVAAAFTFPGFTDSSGGFSFAGTFDITDIADATGLWTIGLDDTFDDGVNPDYTFGDDSSLTLVGSAVTGQIPEPGTIGLSLFGLGALAWHRRRRRNA